MSQLSALVPGTPRLLTGHGGGIEAALVEWGGTVATITAGQTRQMVDGLGGH